MKTILKILLLPFKLIIKLVKSLINLILKLFKKILSIFKIKKNKSTENLPELMERLFDKYQFDISFKLDLSDKGEQLIICSKNYETLQNETKKSKKTKKDEIIIAEVNDK